jgi:threonine dehydratase
VLTYEVVKRNVDEILLVSEDEIEKGVFTAMSKCHIVVEPSAAASLAALREKARLRAGEKVVVVVSGGNISLKMISRILAKYG